MRLKRRGRATDMTTKLTPGFSRRAIVIAIFGAALLGVGGWMLYSKLAGQQPQTTAQVKRSIWKFLAKQTGSKTFKAPADIPTNAVAAAVIVTNKAGRIRPTIPKAGLPESGVSAYFRAQQAQAASYPEIFRLIGQQLTVVEQLLESGESRQQVTGLVLASEASAYARTNAVNLWLGARICEAYLWPNLSMVETNSRSPLTTDTLLNTCEKAFRDAGETNNMIRNYEYLITKSKRPSDSARYRLARLYQDQGEDAKALALMKQIKTIKTPRFEWELATLEKRVSAQKK